MTTTFSVGFFVQLFQIMYKFFGHDTSLDFSKAHDPDLRFPDLILCPSPGYKSQVLADLATPAWHRTDAHSSCSADGGLLNESVWKRRPSDKEQASQWFHRMTYSAEELLEFDVPFSSSSPSYSGEVSVSDVHSLQFGRCVKVRNCHRVGHDRKNYFKLAARFPDGVEKMELFFADDFGHAELGINAEFWLGRHQVLLTGGKLLMPILYSLVVAQCQFKELFALCTAFLYLRSRSWRGQPT